MLEVWCESRIYFRVRANTFGKRVPKDRDYQEPTEQLERRVRKGDMVTCLVQIVDKPGQVIFLKILHPLFIFLPVKCVIEPIGKLGGRSVEG